MVHFNRHFILRGGQSMPVVYKSRVTFAFPEGLPSGQVQIKQFSWCVNSVVPFVMSVFGDSLLIPRQLRYNTICSKHKIYHI